MSATTWRSMLTMPVSPARDHIRGPIDAPVTLLEYGDYECPFCGAAHAVVNTILAQVGDAVRFVFRHFPMTTAHLTPNWQPASRGGRGQPATVLGHARCALR